MSSNTAPMNDVYTVYVPYDSSASSYPFRVPKDALVRDLTRAMRDDPDLKPHLEDGSLSLFKYGKSSKTTREARYNEALAWLRGIPESAKFEPADRLKTHFTDGPAREDEEKIDVIAVNESYFDVHCTVYVPYGTKADVYPFRVRNHALVRDLARAIRDDPDLKAHVGDETLYLFKCGKSFDGSHSKKLYDEVFMWLRNRPESEKLKARDRLTRHFSSGPKREDEWEIIDVIAATDSILESPDTVSPLPDLIKEHRRAQIERIKNFPSPSDGVKSPERLEQWINAGHGVHAHQPNGNYGPPTALFHPALARLKDRLMHLEQVEHPDAEYLYWSHRFLDVCSTWHKEEKLLERELKDIICTLIDEVVIWQMTLEGNIARADAAFVGTGRLSQLLLGILELKVLNGMGGNASLQGSLVYAKALTQSQYEKIIHRSNCPVILIGISGTRLEISTAIFTDGIYVDKLFSQDLYIDAWQSETVLRVGRIFTALSLALVELRQYYQTLAVASDAQPTTTHLYPDPLPVEGEGIQIPRLEYVGKLSHTGRLVKEEETEYQQLERPYGLYRAKMDMAGGTDKSEHWVDVVVKFTVRYSKEAHEVLAEKRLAPTLHLCVPLVGGMYMVIMEYVEGTPLYRAELKPEELEKVHEDVAKAVSLLHERDLVFGDLRAPNVLCKPGETGAMLIDFDWVGKHNVDRYPASLNKNYDEKNNWAPEVDRGVLMDKAHDIYMLGKLKESVKK